MIPGKLLRIFVDEDDRVAGRPLHLAIVDELRAAGFSGATVRKGIEGFGPSRRLRAARAIDSAAGMPVLIEVIEDEAKIVALLPRLEGIVTSGLLTLETIYVTRSTGNAP